MAALRRLISAAAVALGCALALPARAQETSSGQSEAFGSKRPLVLALENIGGFAYSRVDPDEGDTTSDYQAGMFLQFPAGLGGPMGRLGLHYFVSPPISLGLLLGYADNDQLGTTWSTGARVGFAMSLSGRNAIWLRGGIAYTHTKLDFGGLAEITISKFSPGGEILFVIEPVEGFGFMLGPMFEYGFGKREAKASFLGSSQTTSEDFKTIDVGLTFGILADF